eukprot:g63.t1
MRRVNIQRRKRRPAAKARLPAAVFGACAQASPPEPNPSNEVVASGDPFGFVPSPGPAVSTQRAKGGPADEASKLNDGKASTKAKTRTDVACRTKRGAKRKKRSKSGKKRKPAAKAKRQRAAGAVSLDDQRKALRTLKLQRFERERHRIEYEAEQTYDSPAESPRVFDFD